MILRLALAFVFLAACDDTVIVGDVADVVMPARAIPQTDAEIDFATDLLNDLQVRSINERREYCGLIGVTEAGHYIATPARRGSASTCLPQQSAGRNVTILASYHTHAAYDRDFLTEIPSFDDMRTDIEDGTDGYIATPGGRLWYIDARAREAHLLCGAGCLVSDSAFEEDPTFPVRNRYTLQDLRAY